ncbi:hypothetical protein AYX14_07164 [Cryptococcus neoformans]|nr:hypothetical protein AYX15_07179 [Cryptococcus neoformans var. grubii]OWZ60518.1 hypothetical protein AYX14_07164 [Cryptococcus neoformans var. grubii]
MVRTSGGEGSALTHSQSHLPNQ